MKRPEFDSGWSEEVQRVYEHDMQEIWDPAIAPQVWNHYHAQLDRYLRIAGTAPKRILDVGCAQATLALLLAERGHDVVATDLREGFLDYARSRYVTGSIRFLSGDVFKLEPGQTFDLIFCNQLLEHLVYPGILLLRLKSWLAPGGRLVVTTPNGSYIRITLPSFAAIGDPAQNEQRQFTADGDGHFFAYRPSELRGLLSGAGFRKIDVSFFETPWISGHMKFRYLQKWVNVRILRLLDSMTAKTPALGRFLSHQLMGIAA